MKQWYNIIVKKVFIKSDKETLKGTLFYPKTIQEQNPALIFLHGWKSSEKGYLPRAQSLSKLGFICLTISYRGHGESDGNIEEYSRHDHLNDVTNAYDFLKYQKYVDCERIGAIGKSIGGYFACLLVLKRKLRWLVLSAPALYPDINFNKSTAELVRKDPSIYRQYNETIQNNMALQGINKFQGKLFIIQNGNDLDVPEKTIINYRNCIPKNKKYDFSILKGADHNLTSDSSKKTYIRLLIKWFIGNK